MADKAQDASVPVVVNVKSVASKVAECEEIILRDGDQRRLLFRAKLVGGRPDGAVRGHLVWQRKKSSDSWDACENLDLRTLKAGESVSIELKTADIGNLRQWLNDLQLIKEQFGLAAETRFIGIRKNPMAWLTGGEPISIHVPPGAGSEDVVAAVSELLRHADLAGVASALRGTTVTELLALRQQLGLSVLDKLLLEWDQDRLNESEEHWQSLLTRHSFALEQVFHVPSVVVGDKAYVGGKSVSNKGGNVADFLLKTAATGQAMLVEIKTPKTKLLGGSKPYRNNAWNMDSELTGATIQVLTYREQLMEEMNTLDQDGTMLRRSSPACAVIIGSSSTLDGAAQKRSFELYRKRPDVVVLTFDELRHRLQAIRDALVTAMPG